MFVGVGLEIYFVYKPTISQQNPPFFMCGFYRHLSAFIGIYRHLSAFICGLLSPTMILKAQKILDCS